MGSLPRCWRRITVARRWIARPSACSATGGRSRPIWRPAPLTVWLHAMQPRGTWQRQRPRQAPRSRVWGRRRGVGGAGNDIGGRLGAAVGPDCAHRQADQCGISNGGFNPAGQHHEPGTCRWSAALGAPCNRGNCTGDRGGSHFARSGQEATRTEATAHVSCVGAGPTLPGSGASAGFGARMIFPKTSPCGYSVSTSHGPPSAS